MLVTVLLLARSECNVCSYAPAHNGDVVVLPREHCIFDTNKQCIAVDKTCTGNAWGIIVSSAVQKSLHSISLYAVPTDSMSTLRRQLFDFYPNYVLSAKRIDPSTADHVVNVDIWHYDCSLSSWPPPNRLLEARLFPRGIFSAQPRTIGINVPYFTVLAISLAVLYCSVFLCACNYYRLH